MYLKKDPFRNSIRLNYSNYWYSMVQYKERLNLFFSINMYICICEISHGDEISMHSEEKLDNLLLSFILSPFYQKIQDF